MKKLPVFILTLLTYTGLFAQQASTPPAAKTLINCYKGYITGYADNHIIFADGSKMLWNDGIDNKTAMQLLEHPDLKDMFIEPYPKEGMSASPGSNSDPGRIRDEAFFMKIYGATKTKVEQNLTTITWCPKLVGQRIEISKVNGVDKQLIKVSEELDKHPELQKYLVNIGGTFNWRNIKGTDRPSMHSFGITIDINTAYSDYWEWHCNCTNEAAPVKYHNQIPQLIVDTFEKYGFIWGGKWYHYDTMHFEYRPELLTP